MSPKITSPIVGLAALGLFGSAPSGAADPPAPAPPGSAQSVAPAPRRAVLLLTDGKTTEGLVSFDGTRYFVHTAGGKIPYPKGRVEREFATRADVYQYKASLIPAADPDEHLKLAQWCLSQKLNTQAMVHLRAVLAVCPKDPQATPMLENLEAAEARAMVHDSNVVQTSATTETDRPEPLNPAFVGRAMNELKVSNYPQIPGLPTALSVKRAGEYFRIIDPIVQARCARCHNEQFPGKFRLVHYRTKHDATADARRANLDEVLRLINFEEPVKSDFLSSTLRPHGAASKKRPIFSGANDSVYRVLARWVDSLKPSHPGSQARFAEAAATSSEGTESFAVDRAQVPLPLSPTPASGGRPAAPEEFDQAEPPLPGQVFPGTGSSTQYVPPPGTEFPVPYLLGGPEPKLGGETARASSVPLPKTAARGQRAPGGPTTAGLPELPADGDEIPKPKRPVKPLKLDPELLERAILNRNAPR
jgi:hypothetical protein